jgi:hypothetical protein
VIRRAAAVAIALLLPLTLAASDPRNDAVACLGAHGRGDPPDLVAAVGRVGEEGSAAVWRLTFAQPLRVPDPVDPPFRIDVLIRDPKVPVVSFGDYRDFNRIVRFEASSADAHVQLLFIAEGGHTLFDPPVIDRNTMTIQMPGRLLLGADEFGRAAMERLRWTVVLRDGGRCDPLGDGSPTLRLVDETASPPATSAEAPIASTASGRGAATIALALVVVGSVAAFAVLRRRR